MDETLLTIQVKSAIGKGFSLTISEYGEIFVCYCKDMELVREEIESYFDRKGEQ